MVPCADPGPVSWDEIRRALAPAISPVNYRAPAGPAGPPPPLPVTTAVSDGQTAGSGQLVVPRRGFDDVPGEESPLDWYSRHDDIEELLTSAGWVFAYESEGRRHYRRPGKREGVSGNVKIEGGRQVFYNFSSSVDLPTDQGMSAGQLYTWLEHGGRPEGGSQPDPAHHDAATDGPTTPLPSTGTNQDGPAGISAPRRPPTAPEGTEEAKLLVVPTGTPEPVRAFWSRRPELAEIWWKSPTRWGVTLGGPRLRAGPGRGEGRPDLACRHLSAPAAVRAEALGANDKWRPGFGLPMPNPAGHPGPV